MGGILSHSFTGNGIITLTTDFGLRDPFVGVMKGVVLSRFPAARVVDLTHAIRPFWPIEAGFWLSRSWRHFPSGTVHVAVVDPGVGTSRKILIAQYNQQVFLAPDNGLLSFVTGGADEALVYAFEPNDRLGLPVPSATFHGRDIFAPLAAELARGAVQPHELGPPVDMQVDSRFEVAITASGVAGAVITIDHFGNLISNIDGRHLARFRQPVVEAGGRRFRLVRTYGEAAAGEDVALVNAFGVLEIARVQDSAAAALSLERGAVITLTDA